MEELDDFIGKLEPEEALAEIAKSTRRLFEHVDEEAVKKFVARLFGEADDSKTINLVHLWLAECMDEGIDPKQMCQQLVDKVAQSKCLTSLADPDILILFEDWLEELEMEVIALFKSQGTLSRESLAEKLGLSLTGAAFLINKLKHEGAL